MDNRLRMIAVAENLGIAEKILVNISRIYADDILGAACILSNKIQPDEADVFLCLPQCKDELVQIIPTNKILVVEFLRMPQPSDLSPESFFAVSRWVMSANREIQNRLNARTIELAECLQLLTEEYEARLKLQAKLEYASTHDSMTDCRNRRYFDQCLRRVDMDRVSSVAVLLASLSGVKIVNETFGHPDGDRMIFETAQILRESVRRQDTVARLGGDEFGILFEDVEKPKLLQIVRQVRGKVNKWRKQKHVPVGLSIGYAIDERQEVCSSHLLLLAERRMCSNKNKRKRDN